MSVDVAGDLDINEISTWWSDLRDAHRPEVSEERVMRARERLLNRYRNAIIRYVRGAVGGEDAANELFQNFCVRFLRGDFHRADPDRGRFRDYLKSSLFHLVQDHYREVQKHPVPGSSYSIEPFIDCDPARESDEEFLRCWRDELMVQAWNALEDHERRTGKPIAQVIRYSIEHNGPPSAKVAQHFSELWGRPISADLIRKYLMDGRRLFRESLVHQVSETLTYPSLDDVEEELIDLGLHKSCRDVLERRRRA